MRTATPTILIKNAEKELPGLVKMVTETKVDWFALHLTIPELSREQWATPKGAQLITNLFGNSFAIFGNYYVLFLWDNTVLIFCKHAEKRIDMEMLSKHASLLLASSPENEARATSRLYEIDTEQGKTALKTFCISHLKAHQEYLENQPPEFTFTLNITPADIARRSSRVGETVVLIIEDDEASARLLKYTIDKKCTALHASSAKQAKELYENNMPDLVFLDIGLPDVDGLTILDVITHTDDDAFIVMLTANSFAENVKTAIKSGAKGFIAKPFTADKVQAFLAKCRRIKTI